MGDESTTNSIEIEWVNHASFILTHGSVRLISDPWLFGSAFNNGWDLLCETRFRMDEFANITHMWFSHEHPDHFSPPVIKQIPAELRAGITVIFQETKDQKVLDYCRGLGFQVQELPNHQWHDLAPGFRVMCGKVPFFDSWLLMETEAGKVLNVNDCVVDGDGVASEIARHTGTVDLLLTQFSYANWIGNPPDIELRRESAREKLDRVRIQIEAFQPAQTIPFASFVYFSHEENVYLNDAINTIRDAETFIATQTRSQPIVLYPGDRWTVGQPHDNEAALRAYDGDYQLEAKPLRRSEPVPVDELVALADGYRQRMRAKNSGLLMSAMALPPLRYFDTVTFYLMDLEEAVAFNMQTGLKQVEMAAENADVSLASESLAFVFKFDWGLDTLDVNGRFRASPEGHARLIKTFFLGPLNNTGRYLHPRTIFDPSFMRRALRKLWSLSVGG